MKDMHCRDFGIECGFVACGAAEEQVKQIVVAHLFDAHGVRLSADVERAIESLIHDVNSEAHARSLSRVPLHVSQA